MKDFLCRKPYIHDNDILTRLFYTRITKMKEKKRVRMVTDLIVYWND